MKDSTEDRQVGNGNIGFGGEKRINEGLDGARHAALECDHESMSEQKNSKRTNKCLAPHRTWL